MARDIKHLQVVDSTPIDAQEPLSALFLTEAVNELNEGATFLEHLSMEEVTTLRRRGSSRKVAKGETVFLQGTSHDYIYLIEKGRVRTYCSGPSGRELTLAYWTPGHFVGGPEVFGGTHIWSADAMEECQLMSLSGQAVRDLVEQMPSFAVCLINALVAKGKCYSYLVHMLGTRTVSQRLAQLLIVLGRVHGQNTDQGRLIDRHVTHDQMADIVGSTRQWVSVTFTRWQDAGVITMAGRKIVILLADTLEELAYE